jgi:hypothetical protein
MIKKYAIVFSILIVLGLFSYDYAEALSESDIYLSSRIIPQGDMSLIKIRAKEGENVRVTWLEKDVSLITDSSGTVWQGFLAADLQEEPGHYRVIVNTSPSGDRKKLEIEIVDKDYGVRNLTLPKEMVDLDEETLKKVRKEYAVIDAIWEASVSDPCWNDFFMRPVDGEVVGPFGRRSIINDQPRSPHSGVDLRGAEGTPVKAANEGKVVLTSHHFFSGNSIYVDHGGGVISMYFHLKEIKVKQDDTVRKGQIIGLVGSTGRSTGPHLHWGVRINGARVNPLSLCEKSMELEE